MNLNINLIAENVIQFKNLKEHQVSIKDYICNPAACSCKNGKYVEGIIDDSVIVCDEIIEETKTVPTKIISTNFKEISIIGNLWNKKIRYFTYLFITYFSSIFDSFYHLLLHDRTSSKTKRFIATSREK